MSQDGAPGLQLLDKMQNHCKLTIISMVHEKNVQNHASFKKNQIVKEKKKGEI